MAERIEVNGIDAPCDAGRLADARFMLLLGDLTDETLTDWERVTAMARIARYLFGDERARILDALAGGGDLAVEAFSAWLVDYLQAVGSKNS